jgi:N-acetyl sugar amidotransferase
MPSTKPDLQLDAEGVCSACRSYESRPEIDWDLRKIQLENILEASRISDGSNWDCIVPVSGGKDSTYQVVRMLEMGMNPLCVTSTTCDLSEMGRLNLENLKKLGVDSVSLSPNPRTRATLNRLSLRQVGDISWPEHVGIFTIPVRAAVAYNVPLIVWGENSQHEYGGPAAAAESDVLTRRWLQEFGGLLGMRVSDLVGLEGLTANDLIPYTYPTDDELSRVGVRGIFLGHYIAWDGLSNSLVATANGFRSHEVAVEGSMVNYENLDNHQTGIHDYFKFLKFGFSRTTDIACLHVRRGRLSRLDALQVVRSRDGLFPWTYLGKDLSDILAPIGISLGEFIEICDQFTNKGLFIRDASGALVKDANGNLTKVNYDNV